MTKQLKHILFCSLFCLAGLFGCEDNSGETNDFDAIPNDGGKENVIYYTTTDGGILQNFNSDAFDVPIFEHGGYIDGLYRIIFMDKVTSIGECAFIDCSTLKKIIIPKCVTEIGASAFGDCTSLESINIPQGITSIGGFAFAGCKSLTSITIPNSVTLIDWEAFHGCTNLTKLYCKPTTPPSLVGLVLFNNPIKIYVPIRSVEAYKSALGWSHYADSIVGYDFE